MGSTSITPGVLYLSAFQRPVIPELMNHPHAAHFISPIFGALTPILESAALSQENPLDLSSKLLANSSIRQASVIQHTKSVTQDATAEILPTCFHPKVDLQRLRRISGNNSVLDEMHPRQSDENSSNQSATNRMSYPREFKLMVIEYFYANGQNKYRTCKEFQITKSMLNGWLQKADKIRLSRPGSLKSGRSGRRPQFPDIEKQLYELFSHEVDKGNKVGNRWIRDMARMLAKQQCSRQELDGMCQFSERWLSNFKKRYKINLSKDNDTTSGGDSSCSASSHHDYEDSPMEKVAEHEKHNETLIMTNELDETESEHDSENGIESMLEEAHKTRPNSRQLVQEILNQPGELPIQAFYKRFPWLCKRTQPQKEKGSEPNRRGRKVQFPEVERLLHERVLARIAQNGRVSNKWLQQNAKEIAKLLDPSFKISSRFQFSDHWLHNFKKRYGLTLKATKQEKTPETKQETLSSSAFPQGWPGNEMLQVSNWFTQQPCRFQPVCLQQIPLPNMDKEHNLFVT